MAELTGADKNDLPDDAFAYIEPGGSKDASGKTVPRSLRHFPIHDAPHVRNALARAPQSPHGAAAMPKIKAAAKRFGIETAADDPGRSMERVPVERRYIDSPVECRAETNGRRIGGYAAVFHTPGRPVTSRNLGGFVERVLPIAFNQARMGGWSGAVCRYNHSPDMLLGTTAGKTLELEIDKLGLNYTVLPPKARDDIVELVGRGDVQHSSFAFRVPAGGEEWDLDEDTHYPVRSLVEVQLVDVAPVVDPAYPDATAGLRSLADHMGIDLEEVRKYAQADELRKFFIRTDVPSAWQLPARQEPKAPAPKRLLGAAAAAQLMERRMDPYFEEG